MGTALRVPDQSRVLYPQFDPDQEPTPEQALDDGEVWAADEFVQWMRADDQEQELYDYLMQEANSIVVRSLIKAWSEKRQRGEL
ncbi:hypothetical protein Q8G38_16240 [Halomonas venusta]|uniref:hypothetical protein n=1 Tax=Halomonadaceae TaxID=28256 RepID=UPI000B5B1D0D|nr:MULTISPECIES: hypothetical protein [Halomonas]ASK18423.1 hypothetical protein CEK60_03465 [Halomonas sp. N3-2A]MDW0360864.1 hypothetical protein [Halomonas venusta]